MVDLPLLAWLLRSIGRRTRVIFVGDKDQLQSALRVASSQSQRFRGAVWRAWDR
jgi:ATP-dependent exoDNAse (exonuclease V) alpha subunit